MAQLDDLLLKFREETDGFISTDIVGIADGISIGGGSIVPNFDSTAASAEFATVTQSILRALRTLGNDNLEDVLVTTDNAYILLRILQNNKFYHGLAISKTKGNLGRARLIMKNYDPLLSNAIPK